MLETAPTWKDIATWCGGLLVGGLQLVGLWQIKRIGALEEGKADKSDLRDLITEIRTARASAEADRKEERESAEESRGALHEKVNAVALAVARLEGNRRRGS